MENKIYKRQFREQSDETKQKISDSMKKYHETKGVNAARTCASKQSEAMKRYWMRIPTKSDYNSKGEVTMQDYLGNSPH
jgi:hypothetical protein